MSHTTPVRFGLIGEHLGHSLSPLLHRELFSSRFCHAEYRLYEKAPEQIGDLKQWAKENDLSGLNVTIPYKQTVLPLCDQLHDSACQIGAVNTIKRIGDRWIGYNTDYLGVLFMFRRAKMNLADKHISILGCGGASKAFIYAAHIEHAASITVAARNEDALQALSKQFPYIRTVVYNHAPSSSGSDSVKNTKRAAFSLPALSGDILINTTPVGMYPHEGASPVPSTVWDHFEGAADAIYNPLQTCFLKEAAQSGLPTASGLHMLIGQAAAAQDIWFEQEYTLTDNELHLLHGSLVDYLSHFS